MAKGGETGQETNTHIIPLGKPALQVPDGNKVPGLFHTGTGNILGAIPILRLLPASAAEYRKGDWSAQGGGSPDIAQLQPGRPGPGRGEAGLQSHSVFAKMISVPRASLQVTEDASPCRSHKGKGLKCSKPISRGSPSFPGVCVHKCV